MLIKVKFIPYVTNTLKNEFILLYRPLNKVVNRIQSILDFIHTREIKKQDGKYIPKKGFARATGGLVVSI